MGLLEKALYYYNLEAEKKTAGLLAGAALYSKSLHPGSLSPAGLLAKAERFLRESGLEGLYDKAQRFGEAHVPRGMKVGKVGLLEKAIRFHEEGFVFEESVVATEAPELEKLAAAAPIESIAEEPEAPAREKTAVAVPSAKKKKAKPKKAAKTPAPVVAKQETEEQTSPAEEPLPQVFERLVREGDALATLARFAEVTGSEGYEAFCAALLETFMNMGRGKSAFLITLGQRGYREDESVISDKFDLSAPGSRRKKIVIGKSSKLIRHIVENRESLIVQRSVKDEKVLDACGPLEPYDSWSIAPIYLGEFLAGFILLGNQSKRVSMPREQLKTMARLASFFIVPHVIERNADDEAEKLTSQREELLSLLQLYNYSIISQLNISEVFARIAGEFDIEAGVVLGGWDGGGSPEVITAVGLSLRGVSRYRVSKSDREINAILREGAAGIPADMERRLNGFLKGDRDMVNTYVVVPIQFYGQTLGTVNIHRMKGVTGKLTSRMADVLQHIAQSLVPFLLYNRMTNIAPFEVFESLLEREAKVARKRRSSLHVVAFKIKNFKALMKEKGFARYRRILDRFSNLIRNKVSENGVVHILSLNKVVLLLVMKDGDEATALIGEVKTAVSDMLEKEKEKLPFSFSPLRTTYPNESRSVSEILQLIE
jgi:GGDEF domain-containing protein